MTEDANVKYLELIHTLSENAQKTIETLTILEESHDYYQIPLEKIRDAFQTAKMTLVQMDRVLKMQVEHNLEIQDKLDAIVRNLNQN